MSRAVHAFACSVVGAPEWGETIHNAHTAGEAKAEHWRQVREPWPDVPFTAVRARKVGPPHTSDGFARNAVYRGIPAARCGQRVKAEGYEGVVVAHDGSANLVLLTEGGQRLHVHPADCEFTP